ncbi:MAG: hypothetical protein LBS25_01725 [Candidatus Symbiothrix sp.]|nr:hypothetical protein [Candidatus Symbiothrix sp.]
MKKLVLFAAVAAVVGLSACKKAAPAEEVVVPEETIEAVVEEAPAVDTTVVVEEVAPVAE